jgi:magnesium/cobalt transport protein CorA
MGIRCTDDAAFLKLVRSVDRDSRHRISFAQFDAAVHKLKLVHLFDEGTVRRMVPQGYHPASVTVSDFSRARLQQYALTEPGMSSFFTAKRPPWVSVRWINVVGRDSLTLKRLAIKYRLHPLAIEDTLEMHERPKFDRYENHLFLVFPVLRMELFGNDRDSVSSRNGLARARSFTQSMSTALAKQLERHTSFRQRRSPTAAMTSVNTNSPHLRRRTSSIGSDRASRKSRGRRANSTDFDGGSDSDDDDDDDPFRLWIEHVAIFIVGDNTVISVKNEDGSAIWQELTRRLAIPYSKLRHNNANFLVYAALDVIVDQVTTVVDTISDSLMELEDELEEQKHKFDVARLRFLKNELFRLPRLLKPAREVLKNLIESRDFDEAVTAYVRDVHDHVVQVLDDIELHLQMCRLLSEDYREARANQMNYVIYTLTIVTTVFLPAQFLTGVYGMNFDNMPELHERYGYALFWVFVLAIGATLQLYFRYKKWI